MAEGSKAFWKSKTFWVNSIGMIALVAQSINNTWIISPEIQAQALAGINFILRIVTKGPVSWS